MEQDEFAERLAAYRRGEFSLIGIRAKATIRVYLESIPKGSANFVTVESPGPWGIEDDSDEEYLREIEEQERAELIEQLKALRTLEV